MDPVQNPYAPGAGTPPPELAGREELREAARVALARVRAGKPGNRPLVKDVEKMLLSYGAVRMPKALKRRLKKAGMYGMPSE